jgi:predicted Fe-S protein YdhL (DUF1289 family)
MLGKMIDKTPTTCKGNCRLNPILHYCMGCFRTLEQISKWRDYSEEEKNKILNNKTYQYIDDDRQVIFD